MDTSFKERYIKARREMIARDFSSLNPQQKEAVMTVSGPLLILAGAGSGKTTVVINRVINLLRYGLASESDFVPSTAREEDIALFEAGPSEEAIKLAAVSPVKPWRVLAITFTNKAAGELRDRLEKAIGPEASDIWAQTFHSACVRILRRDADRLGFSKSFTIYDTSDMQSVVKHILSDNGIDEKNFPPRAVLSEISKAKDSLLSVDEFQEEANASGDRRRMVVAGIYKEYMRRLRNADAMDFDDLIVNTIRLLEDNPDILEYYGRKFEYVFVDEYQDTNNMQYRLTSLLASGSGNICVVGDDDQSIYKFRGATIENILSFEDEFRGTKVIKLEQNYRSTMHILEAANAVIRNNKGRKDKHLFTDKSGGYMPVLKVCYNDDEEAEYIAARILESFSSGESWSDNAVLYRINAQSNRLEYALKRNAIPYKVYGGMKFFDRAEIKDILAYLSVIVNPGDDLRLMRIINVPARGIGKTTCDALEELAAKTNDSIFNLIKNCEEIPALVRSSKKLLQFYDMMVSLSEAAREKPADEVFDLLLEKTGYVISLLAKSSDENRSKAENVNELKSNIVSFMKNTGETGISAFLDEVALYTDLDTMDTSAGAVSLMTMHSSKGLEFKNVYIAGAEEGIFPGIKAIGAPEEMEEERRLCYVAITRAEEKLYITAAKQRMLFGRTSANSISRFVEEIPEEHLEKIADRRKSSFSTERGSSFGGYTGYGQRSTGTSGASRSPYRVGGSSGKSAGYSSSAGKTSSLANMHSDAASGAAVSYAPGDRIKHKYFGDGEVISVSKEFNMLKMQIKFDSGDTKQLLINPSTKVMSKA